MGNSSVQFAQVHAKLSQVVGWCMPACHCSGFQLIGTLPYFLAVISNLNETFHLNGKQQLWTRPAGRVSKLAYGNFENMSAVIAPAGASSVTLQFTAFRTELNYDFLSVRSCTAVDCAQTSLLGRYSGPTIPGPLTSSTGIMLIQWTSDDVTTESGWSASWSSVVVGGSLRLRPSPRTNLSRRLPRSPFPKPIRLAKTREAAALPAPSAGASACSGSPCSAGSYGAAGTPAAVVAHAPWHACFMS